EVLAPLTDDPDEVALAAQRFFPRLGSNLTMGIRASQGLLEAGRDLAVVPDPEQVIILLVGSANDGGPEEALAEARLAKEAGITIVTSGAGIDADVEMLEQMASSASLFYTEGTSSRFPSLFQQIARDLGTVRPTAATITNTLPAAFDYVFGSGFPVPRKRGQDLAWQFGVWPPAGLAVEYELEAKALGRQAVSARAAADLILDRGPAQRVDFPVPEVEVVTALTVTPPPATATPGATPTPHLRRAFLPYLARSHCVVPGPPGDVVFVMDTSASMLDPAPAGGVKMDHALRAAAAFADSLRYPMERAAVVAYGDGAVVLQGLSGSRGAVVSALGRMYGHLGRGSRLAPGLDAAGRLLAPEAVGSSRQRLVVVVTDGVGDADAAVSAAGRLGLVGVQVAVVGLGDQVARDWLARVASRPALAAHVDVAPDLDAALRGFRRELLCGLD
ncbi:MAG: vWA domain-containing protein, partial [Anaerolineae bacterium]